MSSPNCKEIVTGPEKIGVFFGCTPSNLNRKNSDIRECIITCVNNRNIDNFLKDETYGKQWKEIKEKTIKIFDDIYNEQVTDKKYHKLIIENIGGSTSNFDFCAVYYNKENEKIISIKVELKNISETKTKSGKVKLKSKTLDDVQDLGNHTTTKWNFNNKVEHFPDFYYKKYTPKVLKLIKEEKEFISKNIDDYVQIKLKNKKDDGLSKKIEKILNANFGTYKEDIKSLFNEAVTEYLEKYYNDSNNIDYINLEKFIKIQQSKIFLIWDCNTTNYFIDNLKKDTILLKDCIRINSGKTTTKFFVKSTLGNEYSFRLRSSNTKEAGKTPSSNWELSFKRK